MTLAETLRRWLFPIVGNPETDDDVETPPEPERHHYEETVKRTVYRTTLTYHNGDTETFHSYGIYSRSEDFIKFNREMTYSWSHNLTHASHAYERRSVHVVLLSREPELEPVATEWWELTYETDDCLDPMRDRDERLDADSITIELTHAVPHTRGDV